MKFEPKHYAILAGMLAAIGAQLMSLEHGWHDAFSPIWVGATMVQIATTITALFVGSPSATRPAGTSVIDEIAKSVP